MCLSKSRDNTDCSAMPRTQFRLGTSIVYDVSQLSLTTSVVCFIQWIKHDSRRWRRSLSSFAREKQKSTVFKMIGKFGECRLPSPALTLPKNKIDNHGFIQLLKIFFADIFWQVFGDETGTSSDDISSNASGGGPEVWGLRGLWD